MNNRGQAIGIARFFLGLLVGAILFMVVLSQAAPPILNRAANATSHSQANQATMWFQSLVDYFPVIILLVSLFGMVTLAVYYRAQVT